MRVKRPRDTNIIIEKNMYKKIWEVKRVFLVSRRFSCDLSLVAVAAGLTDGHSLSVSFCLSAFDCLSLIASDSKTSIFG